MRVETTLKTSGPLSAKTPELPLLPVATPTHEEIEARAYKYYLERGMDHGHDVEDWLIAEQELQQELNGAKVAVGAQ